VRMIFDADTATFSVRVDIVDIDFNACNGVDANGNADNNDLESYYRKLVQRGLASQENLETLQETLVGDEAGKCNAAIVNFMSEQGFERSTGANSVGTVIMTEKEVAMIDPTYANGAASGGGHGMDMPDAPEEFVKGGEAVSGMSKEPIEVETFDGVDVDEEEAEVSGVSIIEVEEEEEVSAVNIGEVDNVSKRTIESDEPAPELNLSKKCTLYCYSGESSALTWDEKCKIKQCKKCDECST